jgi:flagellar biosynthesis protein FlhB
MAEYTASMRFIQENEPIPETFSVAVAEVLAYVYKLKGKV